MESESLPVEFKSVLDQSFEYIRDWYDVAKFLEGSIDKLRETYGKYSWVWEFIPPAKSPSELQATRREFETNPSLTIDILRQFASDFRIQEVGIQMCKQSVEPTCFVYICSEIRLRMTRLPVLDGNPRRDKEASTYNISDIPAATDENLVAYHTTVSHDIVARLNEYDQAYDQAYNQAYRTRSAQLDFLLPGPIQILKDVFREAHKHWGAGAIKVINQFERVVDYTQGREIWTEVDMQFLSAFQTNVRVFTEMIIGQRVVSSESLNFCFDKLSSSGAARNQHFAPIYEEIQLLRDTVEKQRQIITSLEYRRLLEHLPNKSHYDDNLKLNHQAKTATRYWHEVWKDLVVQELQHMIKNPPGTSVMPLRPLTELFQYQFQTWKKGKSSGQVPVDVYTKWPTYQRGLQLYGELSSNIHQYDEKSGRPYDIKETNWSRSERLMLAALTPSEFKKLSDEGFDVDWDEERKKRGLP